MKKVLIGDIVVGFVIAAILGVIVYGFTIGTVNVHIPTVTAAQWKEAGIVLAVMVGAGIGCYLLVRSARILVALLLLVIAGAALVAVIASVATLISNILSISITAALLILLIAAILSSRSRD